VVGEYSLKIVTPMDGRGRSCLTSAMLTTVIYVSAGAVAGGVYLPKVESIVAQRGAVCHLGNRVDCQMNRHIVRARTVGCERFVLAPFGIAARFGLS